MIVALLLGAMGVSVDTTKHALVSEDELDMIFRDAVQSGVMEEVSTNPKESE